jgi:hypothetical protein
LRRRDVIGAERWRNNWVVVSPPGAVRVDLERSTAKRRSRIATVAGLASGTPVVACASAPGAIGRCATFAAEAGIEVEREYLAFPSAGAPAYLVEDAPTTVTAFVTKLLVAPPGPRLSLPIAMGLGVVRAVHPWCLIRRLAPGRVVVGRKR